MLLRSQPQNPKAYERPQPQKLYLQGPRLANALECRLGLLLRALDHKGLASDVVKVVLITNEEQQMLKLSP